MIRKKTGLFKSQTIDDPNFGTLSYQYDEQSKKHYFSKEIVIHDYNKHLTMTVESDSNTTSKHQLEAYNLIHNDFDKVINNTNNFLYMQNPLYNSDRINRDFRYESLTIFQSDNPNEFHWDLTLHNQIDGFSHLIIKFKDLTPYKVLTRL